MTTTSEEELQVWAYIMTQYNLKPGLRKFDKQGQTAAVKELTQLHVMDTWRPIHAEKLSREEKMKALSLLLFLKEKRTRDIKGRACINGAPQRDYIAKRGCGITYRFNRVHFHHGVHRGTREMGRTMLRRPKCVCQHRPG